MYEKSMTIELFHELLNGEQEESSVLLEALRSLTRVENPDVLAADGPGTLGTWAGWSI